MHSGHVAVRCPTPNLRVTGVVHSENASGAMFIQIEEGFGILLFNAKDIQINVCPMSITVTVCYSAVLRSFRNIYLHSCE